MDKKQIIALIQSGQENYGVVAFQIGRNNSIMTSDLEKIGFLDRSNKVQPNLWNPSSGYEPNPETELYLVQIVGTNPKNTVYFLKIIGTLKEVRSILAPTEKNILAQHIYKEHIRQELPELSDHEIPEYYPFYRGGIKEISIAKFKFTVDVDLNCLDMAQPKTFVQNYKIKKEAA